MADDDEIDVLGDFSFNSCFAQNDQGIPSCSNREDTVHPEWLLDSTATNWYDKSNQEKHRDFVYSRKLLGNNTASKYKSKNMEWNESERALLQKELKKYGRNISKISQAMKTKTKEEIQAFLDTECGLNFPSLEQHSPQKKDVSRMITSIGHTNVLNMVSTGSPTIIVAKVKKKNNNIRPKSSLLKPDDCSGKSNIDIDTSQIYYEDDLIIGSTESIGSDSDLSDVVSKNIDKYRAKVSKAVKKIGNHRRKVSRNDDKKPRNKSKETLKSPQGRQRKDTNSTDENVKSPKMQIILGSGQALPVSEGEQVDGGGGYTIMHTESGDLYEVASEPRRERQRKQPIHLIQCRIYNTEKPAPYEVRLHVTTLIAMDVHAHTSRAEVMGLVGGHCATPHVLTVCAYRPAAAAADSTHCEMDPVSQSVAAEALSAAGARVCGWHHSHPHFPSAPSARDLATQRSLQRALCGTPLPFLGLITSQHWPTGRTASQYRCIRVENEDLETETPIGYQFSVKLVADLNTDNLESFLQEIRRIAFDESTVNDHSINVANDICPQAQITFLEKCISSVRHHMRSAGYEDDDALIVQLLQGIRDVFR